MEYRPVRRRKALSELVSNLLMIGITLIGGAIAISFVSGQLGTSSLQLGSSVDRNINYLRENLVIAYANFPNGSAGIPPLNTTAVLMLYNNGLIPYTISSISITGLIDTNSSGRPGTLETVIYYGVVGGVANYSVSIVNDQTGNRVCNVPATAPTTVSPSLLSETGPSSIRVNAYSTVYALNLPYLVGSCGVQLYLSGQAYTVVVTGTFGTQTFVVRVK